MSRVLEIISFILQMYRSWKNLYDKKKKTKGKQKKIYLLCYYVFFVLFDIQLVFSNHAKHIYIYIIQIGTEIFSMKRTHNYPYFDIESLRSAIRGNDSIAFIFKKSSVRLFLIMLVLKSTWLFKICNSIVQLKLFLKPIIK